MILFLDVDQGTEKCTTEVYGTELRMLGREATK